MQYDALPTHPAAIDPEDLLKDCEIERTRGSGPGGQHRNKVETAIRIRHEPSGIEATASERRRAEENRRRAVFRLRVELALAVRVPWPDRRSPSRLWMRRRSRNGRMVVNPEHADFPALLAEALDAATGYDFDLSAAGQALGVSTSQLVKLLKAEPRALALVNERRRERGEHAFK